MTATDLRRQPRPQPTAAARGVREPKPRRGDVEGLRAIAVLAVVCFHGAMPWTPGGFVGVDIFFVISGYLITGLMIGDVRKHGRVRLGDFYARRARRILPLAGVVVVATLIATALIRPPLTTLVVAKDAVATMFYVSNWWFLGQQTDYLGSERAPSPLLHFWSLSVEEQFYLFWPLIVLGVALAFRRPRRRLVALASVAVVVAAGSFLLCLWWTAVIQPRAYLATPPRVWQFMAGALLAIGAPVVVRAVDGVGRRRPSVLTPLRWTVGGLGLGLILFSVHDLDADQAYPGMLALLPTAGAALVILAGSLCPPPSSTPPPEAPSGVSWLLARRPLRLIGRLSYSWYLWHWPVVVLVPYVLGDDGGPADLSWQALTVLSVASIVPAWLSMRLVEDPVRFARAFAPVRRGLLVGAVAVVVPVVIAVGVGAVARNDAGESFEMTDQQVAAVMSTPVAEAGAADPDGGAVLPAIADAAKDLSPWDAPCFAAALVSEPTGCHEGDPQAKRRIVLFGDSHAAQWMSPIVHIGQRTGYRVDLRTKSSCSPADVKIYSGVLKRDYRECYVWRAKVMADLAADPPDLVIVTALNASARSDWAPGWDSALRKILATGTPVAYLRPTPRPEFDVPTCVSQSLDNWSSCALPAAKRRADPVARAIRDGRYPGARVVDLSKYLCTRTECPVVRNHVLVYRDQSHLTDTAALGLEPVLLKLLRPSLRD